MNFVLYIYIYIEREREREIILSRIFLEKLETNSYFQQFDFNLSIVLFLTFVYKLISHSPN